MKILVVEDENVIRENTLEMLELKGYDVKGASNGNEAIEILNSFSPYIVFCDIMMPQMNGLDALEKIMTKNPNQKVIMMTAFSTLDKVLKSHKYGAIHYLMKPFDSLESLERKISEVLHS
jgi:DNA-binding NtrC family response regulator